MLRLSDLAQLHAKIESRHLVIPNPTGPWLHLSFSIWMSLSDANKFAEKFLSFCWMLQKLFFFTLRKPIYVLSRRSCLEIASVHGWLALHFVFGDWQCPAGQFLEDSPCTVLEVLRYWFPARAPCSTCQSTSRTVGCRREWVVDVWCLADG